MQIRIWFTNLNLVSNLMNIFLHCFLIELRTDCMDWKCAKVTFIFTERQMYINISNLHVTLIHRLASFLQNFHDFTIRN